MKNINFRLPIVLLLGFCCAITGCYEKPRDKEQYKSEVYIVNAYNRVYKMNFPYEDPGEQASNFITIQSSGSRHIDQDAHVSLDYADTLVMIYNRKYISTLPSERDKWYKLIDLSLVEIPKMSDIVISAKDSIYTNVLVNVHTHDLNPDSLWVVPLTITASSPYPANPTGKNIMLHINLVNQYSGYYKLDGRDSVPNAVRGYNLNKTKYLKAINKTSLRMFYGSSNEGKDYLEGNSIVLSIKDEPNEQGKYPVEVTPWKTLALKETGSGLYDPEKKELVIEYRIMQGSEEHIIKETLKFLREEKEV